MTRYTRPNKELDGPVYHASPLENAILLAMGVFCIAMLLVVAGMPR